MGIDTSCYEMVLAGGGTDISRDYTLEKTIMSDASKINCWKPACSLEGFNQIEPIQSNLNKIRKTNFKIKSTNFFYPIYKQPLYKLQLIVRGLRPKRMFKEITH